MGTYSLGTIGLAGIDSTGFRVSAPIYNDESGTPGFVLAFQGVKQVNGSRIENRNFSAGISISHLVGLLTRYASNPKAARQLTSELPKLQALLDTVTQAEADARAEVDELMNGPQAKGEV
jgi:hypothetical protein